MASNDWWNPTRGNDSSGDPLSLGLSIFDFERERAKQIKPKSEGEGAVTKGDGRRPTTATTVRTKGECEKMSK